ncbi:biotin--[acetyl-CoA-carboxylase] ligase [Roseospira marina]|uniref:biotin--[biotin carboxyl-carrier protein] ligase n=1 Tax=Roseospira marina TaxID=140057 RepID=A0A5M6IAW0_9PROT|nr:biotin--[acetyl-CoA-carboxylase] ligase [Roseospira marina]KAA5604768.1 biotin--[acetyl-CoA-carboxylase] ligase [Roseospira marina]MBB4313450.1 BirA family biotin operon repressor/biotin-[acetyl-CoA-carboxylase] ligase [Roseospira marina]MBB5086612.1 BirA family biotin operon repressor/biotin-[acetyl-CoA-carboxylase] ligase [Roseospira marina]
MTAGPAPATVAAPADTVPEGWRRIAREWVDSTQIEAREALAAPDGGTGVPVADVLWPAGALAVQAGEQTGGRGRHGRVWLSPPGNLYLTVAIPCPGGPRRGVEIGFVGGVAVVRALADLGCDRARLKWPNDVLVDGAKIAGLLPESHTDFRGRTWIVLGMGANVAHAPDVGTTLYPTTTLSRVGGAAGPGVVAALGGAVLTYVAAGLVRWRAEGFAPVRAAWLRVGHGLGEPVRVRLGDDTVRGIFLGLTPEGALRMREDGTGRDRTILAGDVFFPAGGEREE